MESGEHRRGPIRGRGASWNPPNRFEAIEVELDAEAFDDDAPPPRTQYLRDASRTIIAKNDSPDVGFDRSVNPYRGCTHGCAYCFSRPTHEYLGFSAGLDFETRILVKEKAPELLHAELSSSKWKPQPVALSGVTDPYQPVERKLGLTRRCLEVLAEFRNPVLIITKNHLVARDADVLAELARHDAAAVFVSVTTLRQDLTRVLEPRTSAPARRLEAIAALARAGVPVGVLVAPIIPALNDHEILPIVRAAAEAGARFAGHVPLRLPWAVKELFERWLEEHFPDRKDKVLNRVRSLRGGRLNDPEFRTRMRGEGAYAEEIHGLFDLAVRRAGLGGWPALSTAAFCRPGQLDLFGERTRGSRPA